MKKENIRKYLRRADDYMEQIERKMKRIDSALFFISSGMEHFHQTEDCFEANTIKFINDSLKTLRTGDIAELHKTLDKLRET